MREHRGHTAGALLTVTSAELITALAAEVEASARNIGSTEQVPSFGGERGADLARLKVFVPTEQTELVGLGGLRERR
jgi:hypothetical protein